MTDETRSELSGQGPMSNINITPLIDVMLVLLIIFLVVTPIAQKGVDVSLPQTPTEEAHPTPPGLFVTLEDSPDGQVIRLNTRPVSSLRDLALALSDALQARSDKTIFVKAGGTVPYGRVVEAMDIARGAGAERIGILSDVAKGSLP